MKRFSFILFSLLIVILLALPAFASEAPEAGEGESSAESSSGDVYVYNVIGDDLGVYMGSSVSSYSTYSSGSSDLKAVLLQFLGDWETVVVEHSYQASDGSVNTVQETIPDYPWLCSAAVLAIFIFCLFRLGGAVLCRQ